MVTPFAGSIYSDEKIIAFSTIVRLVEIVENLAKADF